MDAYHLALVVDDVAPERVAHVVRIVTRILDAQEIAAAFARTADGELRATYGFRLDGVRVWSTWSQHATLLRGVAAFCSETEALVAAATGCRAQLFAHPDDERREHAPESEVFGIVAHAMEAADPPRIHGLDTTAVWVDRLLARWQAFSRWEQRAILADLAFCDGRDGDALPSTFWTAALDVPAIGAAGAEADLRCRLACRAVNVVGKAADRTHLRPLFDLSDAKRAAVIALVKSGALLAEALARTAEPPGDPVLPLIDAALAHLPEICAVEDADRIPYAGLDLLAPGDVTAIVARLQRRGATFKVAYVAALLDEGDELRRTLECWVAARLPLAPVTAWEPLVFLRLGAPHLRGALATLLEDAEPLVRALALARAACTTVDDARTLAVRAIDEVPRALDETAPSSIALGAELAVLARLHDLPDRARWERLLRAPPATAGVEALRACEVATFRAALALEAWRTPGGTQLNDGVILAAARAGAPSLVAATTHPVPAYIALRCAALSGDRATYPIVESASAPLQDAYANGLIGPDHLELPYIQRALGRGGEVRPDATEPAVILAGPPFRLRSLVLAEAVAAATAAPAPTLSLAKARRSVRQALNDALDAIIATAAGDPAKAKHALAHLDEALHAAAPDLPSGVVRRGHGLARSSARHRYALALGVCGDLLAARALFRELVDETRVELLYYVHDTHPDAGMVREEIVATLTGMREAIVYFRVLLSRIADPADAKRARERVEAALHAAR